MNGVRCRSLGQRRGIGRDRGPSVPEDQTERTPDTIRPGIEIREVGGPQFLALLGDHVHDALDVGLVTEKADAVGLLGISGHKRKIVEQINPANSCAEVGDRLLRRGESLIMEFFDDGEARTPEGNGQCNRRESDEDNAISYPPPPL